VTAGFVLTASGHGSYPPINIETESHFEEEKAEKEEEKTGMRRALQLLSLLTLSLLGRGTASADGPGILLLAHGGSTEWNAQVTKLAGKVDQITPTEVAFGMATRANIQAALDRLGARGVKEVVAVPLFVSSWSSVITSTEYLLGLRADPPRELAIYAKMNHGPPSHDDHSQADQSRPVTSSLPIRMAPALNDHPIVADILTSRARSISRNPAGEAVVIVAHGPSGDEENRRWQTDMASIAERIRQGERFASIDHLTLRDDAAKPVRDRATAELRAVLTKRLGEGRRVLIVPLLVSFGGIERGLRQRLEGLPYVMPDTALVPDERLVTWVLAMANERR
jgi:sirohydrochlorin cobaltochelatase